MTLIEVAAAVTIPAVFWLFLRFADALVTPLDAVPCHTAGCRAPGTTPVRVQRREALR